MNCDELQQLAALAALGAVDDAEATRLRERLERDPAAQAEFGRFLEVAAALAGTVPQLRPTRSLRERVLARVARQPQPQPQPQPQARSGGPVVPAGAEVAPAGFRFLASHAPWREAPLPGARFKLLSAGPKQGYAMILIELKPGTRYPEHDHVGTEELYLLTGDLETEGRRLGPGDFLHAEPGSHHRELYSPGGCTALMVLPAAALAALAQV